jgi:hypothetical protein
MKTYLFGICHSLKYWPKQVLFQVVDDLIHYELFNGVGYIL